jgi:hypothetical protein
VRKSASGSMARIIIAIETPMGMKGDERAQLKAGGDG